MSTQPSVVDRLEDHGLVTNAGKNFYVTQRGLDMLTARDRVDVRRLVKVTHLDPEGADAIRERRHDSAVAEVAAAFRGAGIPVVDGWRWVVSWHDGQLVPDLWVQVPVPGREEGIWVAVEVEFSAKTEKRIEAEKLRSYRLAPIRLNKTFPILVITGEALPAKRFDALARDLLMLTTTLKQFRTGVWEGPESVWRRKGRPEGLSDITREHRAHHLCQRTGRSLDHTKPWPQVWARLAREESIWSDPQADAQGLDRELQPIDPRLQADMNRVLNEAKAGPSVHTPVSASMPPTPTPVPVRKAPTAQDQARRRSEVLIKIHRLVAIADEVAATRLKGRGLSDAERLCLQRVRSIITYGAYLHYQAEDRLLQQSLQRCLMLEDQHLQELRSGNALWWLTMSQTKTDPRHAFRTILKDYSNIRQDACRKFSNWSKMVERAARAVRRTRTPE